MSIRIGLVVDHPKRDLPGACMIAREVARRGGEAFIIPMYEQGVDVPRLGLDTLVINYAREANKDLVQTYASGGLHVHVLDTEGGVLADKGGNAPPNMAAYVRDSGWESLLAGYFFWGSRLRDAFVEAGTLTADRLHLTGCPRFDYAAPRWRKILDRERRGYLLVNANFPLVNPRFSRSPIAERETMIRAGWDGAYVDRFLVDLHEVFRSYLDQVRRIARARPDRTILVRPHPFENARIYHEAFAGLPNVTVDGAGTVLEMIRNADAVLHLNCGTAIEAVLLGVVPFQMEHLNTPVTAGHATLPARISRKVYSDAELFAAIDDLDGERDRFCFEEVHAREIAPFFNLNDGEATRRVVDVLLQESTYERGFVSLRQSVRGSRPNSNFRQRLKGMIALFAGSAFGASAHAVLKPARRDKMISVDHVSALIADLTRIVGSDESEFEISPARCKVMGLPLATVRVAPSRDISR